MRDAHGEGERGKGTPRIRCGALVVAAVLVVAWCAFIFLMSSYPADASGEMSGGFSYSLFSTVWPDFGSMNETDQQYWCDAVDYPVRKFAHFSEYALLGFLAANLGMQVKRFSKRDSQQRLDVSGYVITWGLATLYAASDEIHQAFVPGRACLATDIILDSSGVLAGTLLFILVVYLAGRIKTKHRV